MNDIHLIVDLFPLNILVSSSESRRKGSETRIYEVFSGTDFFDDVRNG